jgi:hypothetical protein
MIRRKNPGFSRPATSPFAFNKRDKIAKLAHPKLALNDPERQLNTLAKVGLPSKDEFLGRLLSLYF